MITEDLPSRWDNIADSIKGDPTKIRYYQAVERLKQENLCEPILDIGCGPGQLLGILTEEFDRQDIYAIDISPKLLEIAKSNNKSIPGERFVCTDVTKSIPFPDNYFSTVFQLDNIEHLVDPVFTLGEVRRVLKPGGHLIITTPGIPFKVLSTLRIWKSFQPVDTPITSRKLIKLLRPLGYEVVDIWYFGNTFPAILGRIVLGKLMRILLGKKKRKDFMDRYYTRYMEWEQSKTNNIKFLPRVILKYFLGLYGIILKNKGNTMETDLVRQSIT